MRGPTRSASRDWTEIRCWLCLILRAKTLDYIGDTAPEFSVEQGSIFSLLARNRCRCSTQLLNHPSRDGLDKSAAVVHSRIAYAVPLKEPLSRTAPIPLRPPRDRLSGHMRHAYGYPSYIAAAAAIRTAA
jgi:hypothetical protein